MEAQGRATSEHFSSDDSGGAGLVGAISRRLGTIGLGVHDAAANISSVARQFERQEAQLQNLRQSARTMAEANRQIDNDTEISHRTAESGQSDLAGSRNAIAQAINCVASLVDSVERIERHLAIVANSLDEVASISGSIEAIARQTNLLALNATIEAARANEAGRGFAVVAGEVKALSGQTREATSKITRTIGALSDQIAKLTEESTKVVHAAQETRDGTRVIENAVDRVGESFKTLTELTASIASGARSNLGHCDAVIAELSTVEEGIGVSANSLRSADAQTGTLLGQLGELVQQVACSGIPTEDTPYLDAARSLSARAKALVDDAIHRSEISAEDVFDRDYVEIANTNPKQYTTRFVAFADRYLRPILDEYMTVLPHIHFALLLDINAYAPTHNAVYSLPQGSDPVWNMANSRNRTKFDYLAVAKKAAQSLQPIMLQTFRRPLGGEKYAMMKVASAPLMIAGRHWGTTAIAYALP
jgi:methyl-accepting chemotaxis protein